MSSSDAGCGGSDCGDRKALGKNTDTSLCGSGWIDNCKEKES